MKLAPLALILLLTLPLVGAQSSFQITYVDSKVEISENFAKETISVEYAAVWSGENVSDVIRVHGRPSLIKVYDNSGQQLIFENIAEENFTAIRFFFASGLTAGEKYQIMVQLTKPVATSENGKSYAIDISGASPP